MCVLIIFTFAWNTSHSTEWNTIKNVYWSSCTVPLIIFKVLIKPEFSQQIFEKYSNIKFQENLFHGSQAVLHRQTCQHNECRDLTDIIRKVYMTLIRPVVAYARETWALSTWVTNSLLFFERQILRTN